MFQWLIEFDKKALLYLNGMHTPLLDKVMWWITGDTSWIPLYLILLIVIIYRERPYRFIYTLLFIAVTVVLCDQISTLIKDIVARPRPTHDYEIKDLVHVIYNADRPDGYRGGAYGFVSSHAANVFGVATFLANQFKHYKWSLFLIAWATVVSYSRIYLGVHYPLDILFGAVLGALIGIQCYVFKVRTAAYVEQRMETRKLKRKAKLKMQKNNEQQTHPKNP
jgi:undecaprenyl-diphosphatase